MDFKSRSEVPINHHLYSALIYVLTAAGEIRVTTIVSIHIASTGEMVNMVVCI